MKTQWYYDDKAVIYLPAIGLIRIRSPFWDGQPLWTDEIEVGRFLKGIYTLTDLPEEISYLGHYLKGQWHVDFLIKKNRPAEEWQVAASLPFTIDDEPPVVEITQPPEGYETEKAKLELLLGTALDNIGVDEVTWENNDSHGTASGSDNWQVNNIPLHKNSNLITVTAKDAALNEGKQTVEVIFNNSPPELTVVEAQPVALKDELYNLSLLVTDINENLREITVNWGDGSVESQNLSGGEANVDLSHIYKTGGIFALIAVATDEEDEAAVAVQPVVVADEDLAKKMQDCEALAYDPIDLSTGAQTLQHTLLSVQGVVPISFQR